MNPAIHPRPAPVCVICGGPRSSFAASKCRACYCAPRGPAPVIGLGDAGGLEIQAVLTLRGELAESLQASAALRSRPPAELLADLIETILEDDLVTAILDDAA